MTTLVGSEAQPRAESASELTAEMLACGLLAKLLYEYPDSAWLNPLIVTEVFSDFPLDAGEPDAAAGLRLLRAWTRQQGTAMSPDALDDLRADYTRLFMGPGKVLAAPWESVYFNDERMVFQEQTLQVRAWYAQFGLERSSHTHEPDDHIGLELSFVAHLAQQALLAMERGDPEGARAIANAQRTFLSDHLLRWAPAWCAEVHRHARTDFYRGVAHLTQSTLAQVGARLEHEANAESGA